MYVSQLCLPVLFSSGVQCVDTDSFPYYRCGSCPAGFTGNGTNCRDLDEVSTKTKTKTTKYYRQRQFYTQFDGR